MTTNKVNKVSVGYSKGKRFQTSTRRNRQMATKRKGRRG